MPCHLCLPFIHRLTTRLLTRLLTGFLPFDPLILPATSTCQILLPTGIFQRYSKIYSAEISSSNTRTLLLGTLVWGTLHYASFPFFFWTRSSKNRINQRKEDQTYDVPIYWTIRNLWSPRFSTFRPATPPWSYSGHFIESKMQPSFIWNIYEVDSKYCTGLAEAARNPTAKSSIR